jgi:hypothetical protein
MCSHPSLLEPKGFSSENEISSQDRFLGMEHQDVFGLDEYVLCVCDC